MLDFIDGATARAPSYTDPIDLKKLLFGGYGNRLYAGACSTARKVNRGHIYLGFLATQGCFGLKQRKFIVRETLDAELLASGLKPKDFPHAQIVAGRFDPGEGTIVQNGSDAPLDYSCFAHIVVPSGFSYRETADALRFDVAARDLFKHQLYHLDLSRYRDVQERGCTPLLRVCRDTGSIY